MIEDMAQVQMTEAELARDIASVLDRVRSGTEVVIERNAQPVAVLLPAQLKRRKLSEIVASLSQQSTATIDPDFAADVQDFIDRRRDPLSPPKWD
jgi:prevent-host-death family protein